MDGSMESSSKRIRAAIDPRENQPIKPPSKRIRPAEDDQLSDLPDSLLQSILCLLESRQVVRSSVLLRRWKRVWRSVPFLDIDQILFYRRHGVCCRNPECRKRNYGEKRACKEEWRPFEEFSDKLMLLHGAPTLDKLRIHVPALDCDDSLAIRPCLRWISRGVRCSPTVIDIHMDLQWSWGNWFLPDLGSNSHRLTRLLLHGVQLDASFAEQLRSGYPVLEHLSLVACFFCRFGDIASATLTHLTIDDCLGNHSFFQGIVVDAPRLTSLRACLSPMYWPNGIYVVDTPSFVKASVCVRVTTCYYHTKASFLDKLYRIFNIRHLELFGFKMMENLQQISHKLPQLHNVRTLLVDRCDLKTSANIQTLDRFLQSVLSLEKLTLQNCEFTDRSKSRTARARWRNVALESQNLTSFKCDNLEVIEIKHSKDDNIDELYKLLMGLWRNLGKTNIKFTKFKVLAAFTLASYKL